MSEAEFIVGVGVVSLIVLFLISRRLFPNNDGGKTVGCGAHHFSDYSHDKGEYRTKHGWTPDGDGGRKTVFTLYAIKRARCEHEGCNATDEKEVKEAVLEDPLPDCIEKGALVV